MKTKITNIILSLTFLLVSITNVYPQWTQQGADIDGEASGDNSGYALSFSADGNKVAIGAPYNDGNGSNSGHVRVYTRSGTTWTQQGADIDGQASEVRAGLERTVSLSADGNKLAIGSPRYTSKGQVRVFIWNGSAWVQQGANINGVNDGENAGQSVALSANGNKLVIGCPYHPATSNVKGQTRVYSWSGTAWLQQGADIVGEGFNDTAGSSVAISESGDRIAIGAIGNDGNGSDSGHVRVYDWNGSAWIQKGTDIDGEAANNFSGYSIALSLDGNVLAIGAPWNAGGGTNSGHARVYAWNGSTWIQRGIDINGGSNNRSGYVVSLSSDGNKLAVSLPDADKPFGTAAGAVKIYNWNGTAWTQQGETIFGESFGDGSGVAMSLSSDGNKVAIGSNYNGNGRGHVRVYIFSNPCEINLQGNATNIANGDTSPSTSDHTDFEITPFNTNVVRTYTIQNTGTGSLDVSSINSSNATNFTVGGITLPATVNAGGSTTFTITMNASSAGAKTATITINNNDTDESTYSFAVAGTVNKGNQTITFNTLPNKILGDAPFTLGATASSNLTVTYTSSNTSVATVAGNTVTIVGVGTTNISANQAGNDNYNAATAITQSLVVNPPSPQNLTVTPEEPRKMNLSWTDGAGEANYVVLRSTTAGSGYTEVATVNANVTAYQDVVPTVSALPFPTYYYVVRAKNGSLVSANSNEASAIPTNVERWVGTEVIVSPNPTTDAIKIAFGAMPTAEIELMLADEQGKVFLQTTRKMTNKEILLSLKTYPKGVYMLTLKQNQQTLTKKIVKQ